MFNLPKPSMAELFLISTPDPAILKLVETWPGVVSSKRANKLGLEADTDYEAIIRDYISENPEAIKLKINL